MWGSSLTRMHKKNPPLPTLFFLPSPLSLVASPTPLLSPTPHPLFHSRLLFSPLLPLDGSSGWWRGVAARCGCGRASALIHSPPPLVRGAPSGGGGRGIWRSPHESAALSKRRDEGWLIAQHRGADRWLPMRRGNARRQPPRPSPREME